ncbi:MAG: FtsL-like putative cell division protein [Bacteroidota bacterium]
MQTENKIKKKRWKQLLQYQWIVKHVPFFLFLALLAVMYIANGHFADKTIRNIAKARAELKQLQYEHKVLKAEVMYRSKESVLVKAVEKIGLKRLVEPPVKITDSTKF